MPVSMQRIHRCYCCSLSSVQSRKHYCTRGNQSLECFEDRRWEVARRAMLRCVGKVTTYGPGQRPRVVLIISSQLMFTVSRRKMQWMRSHNSILDCLRSQRPRCRRRVTCVRRREGAVVALEHQQPAASSISPVVVSHAIIKSATITPQYLAASSTHY